MSRINKTVIFFAVLAVAIVCVYAFGDPFSLSWPLKCPLFWLTGYQCPLCGMQRAFHELLNGNIKEAWTLNPGLFVISPYLLVVAVGQVFPKLQKTDRVVCFCYRNSVIIFVVIAMIAWGIVRNLI